MSLDISLVGKKETVTCVCTECGDKHAREQEKTYFFCNITHNLNRMAEACGLYRALWKPEELRITHANYIIDTLETGLKALRANPDRYKALNPDNKWGSYEGFVLTVEAYLKACKMYPEARIEISR